MQLYHHAGDARLQRVEVGVHAVAVKVEPHPVANAAGGPVAKIAGGINLAQAQVAGVGRVTAAKNAAGIGNTGLVDVAIITGRVVRIAGLGVAGGKRIGSNLHGVGGGHQAGEHYSPARGGRWQPGWGLLPQTATRSRRKARPAQIVLAVFVVVLINQVADSAGRGKAKIGGEGGLAVDRGDGHAIVVGGEDVTAAIGIFGQVGVAFQDIDKVSAGNEIGEEIFAAAVGADGINLGIDGGAEDAVFIHVQIQGDGDIGDTWSRYHRLAERCRSYPARRYRQGWPRRKAGSQNRHRSRG